MNDDSNPMSRLGNGRRDNIKQTMMRKDTMQYSYIDEIEANKRNGGTTCSPPPSIPPPSSSPTWKCVNCQVLNSADRNTCGDCGSDKKSSYRDYPAHSETTVQLIVSDICERDIGAWTSLPKSFRDEMLAKPTEFFLITNPSYPNDIPRIRYKGIEMKWNGADSWTVFGLVK